MDDSSLTLWVVIAILGLSLGGRQLASWIANRDRRLAGKPAISGLLGGTICPKCHRPFAIHLWSIRLVVIRLDRCPHCGRWSFVQSVHPDILAAAEDAALQEMAGSADSHTAEPDEAAAWRRQLDDSRFEDH